MDNNNIWDDLPFRNCNLSIDWSENQTTFNSDDSNNGNKWSMFKNIILLYASYCMFKYSI